MACLTSLQELDKILSQNFTTCYTYMLALQHICCRHNFSNKLSKHSSTDFNMFQQLIKSYKNHKTNKVCNQQFVLDITFHVSKQTH